MFMENYVSDTYHYKTICEKHVLYSIKVKGIILKNGVVVCRWNPRRIGIRSQSSARITRGFVVKTKPII
jgi:hypothetical protein